MNSKQRFSISVMLVITMLAFGAPLQAQQDSVTVFASGLIAPIGIEIDSSNVLWVAEQGTGKNDSRISVITPDGQVYPFLTGLPSDTVNGDIVGAQHLYFDRNGDLLIVQGGGSDSLSASILKVEIGNFVPGAPPLTVDDVEVVTKVGEFSRDNGATESNPYTVVIGPRPLNDFFIVDAGLNGIVRYHSIGDSLSVFTRFDSVPNPTAVGPAQIEPVPTRIVFLNDRFYVSGFGGFPFLERFSRIYQVDLNGNVSILRDSLTSVVDLAIDPRDSNLVFLQLGRFTLTPAPPGFQPNTGGVFKLRNNTIDTLVYGLNMTAGMRFANNGELYVSSLADGTILRIRTIVTSVKGPSTTGVPSGFMLAQNYPNPFALGAAVSAKKDFETMIGYQLPRQSEVQIVIYDVLGNRVRTLIRAQQPAGSHQVRWDGRNDGGQIVAAGVYFYTLRTPDFQQTRKLLLLP